MNRQAPSNDPALTGRALLWPGLLACAAAAVWIDLTRIQANHDADSLVPMFVSLYGWTPFYWSQNRLGMLVPLLATPFSHPFTNLLVQEGLSIFGWFAGLALLSRWVLKDARWSFAAVGLITSFVLLASGSIRHIFMMSVNYGVSVALGVGALLLLDAQLALDVGAARRL